MWSDDIAKRDYLGFDVHANLIKGLIDEPNMLPITIGVFGDWGSGKSSIMESLKKAYDDENDKHTLCLQFNGWVFEGYDDAKAALIEAILKAFESNKTLPRKAKTKIKKLAKSVNWMRVIGFGLKNIAVPIATASITGGASIGAQIFDWAKGLADEPQKITEAIKNADYNDFKKKFLKEEEKIEEQYQVVRKFRDDFKDLLREANITKLVVLIDDLDRCLPDRIIDNLEAIKLFLNVENTAFVIGADSRIVRDAIRHRYADLIKRDEEANENKRVVVDYLEKLIQVPYNLPKLSESEVETYITLLFCEDTLKKAEDMDIVMKAFQKYRKGDRYSVFGFEQIKEALGDSELVSQLEKRISLISKLSPLIAGNLDGNPRQIKRFLNTFVLRNKLADTAKLTDFREDVLAKLMILEYGDQTKFTEIYGWQAQNRGFAIELKQLEAKNKDGQHNISEKFKEWNTPKMITWLDSEPLLADIDLRDYFWISRDTLNSMTDAMTPPIVKTLVSSLMVKSQPEKLKRNKIQNDVKQLQENLQHELFSLLVKRASNDNEQKNVFSLFELMIEEGCACGEEFRSLCRTHGNKPAVKEIVNRIANSHEEYQDLKR